MNLKYLLRTTVLVFIGLNILTSCSQQPGKQPVKIILDTDFGDDGDDLAALAMLHHMQDIEECEIVAVGQANSNRESPCAIDVINTYYGRPDIPIGIVTGYVHGVANQYSSFLIENYPVLYDLDINHVPNAVEVYRRVLENAKEKSIVFVVIGFKKNMSDLLKSPPDSISPLTGIQLVEKKVKFVSDMGGLYPTSFEPEFNFGMVPSATRYYVEHCPVPIIFAGTATGEIKIGQKLRKLNNPVGHAMDYKLSHDGGWGKPVEGAQAAFDCTSALIAVRGADEYFNVKYGCNEIDSVGNNEFHYGKVCHHSHIDCNDRKMSFENIGNIIEDMIITPPLHGDDISKNQK